MGAKIHVDGLPLELTEANAATIQQSVDRAIALAKKDATEQLAVAQAKLDAALLDVSKAEKKLANVKANVAKFNLRRDAAKNATVPCGCTDGKEGEEKCDYCDGLGTFLAMDAKKAAKKAGKKAAPFGKGGDDDEDDDDEEEMDEDELATEQETESEAKKAKKGDSLAREGVKVIRANLDAFAERRAKKLVPLFEVAHKHLGADAKLDGLSVTAIKKLVIAKLAPSFKLDGFSSEAIAGIFALELHKLDSLPSAVDLMRGAVAAPSVPPMPMTAQEAKAANHKRKQDAWKGDSTNGKGA